MAKRTYCDHCGNDITQLAESGKAGNVEVMVGHWQGGVRFLFADLCNDCLMKLYDAMEPIKTFGGKK
jgi:hypothetical protein